MNYSAYLALVCSCVFVACFGYRGEPPPAWPRNSKRLFLYVNKKNIFRLMGHMIQCLIAMLFQNDSLLRRMTSNNGFSTQNHGKGFTSPAQSMYVITS